MRLAPGPRVTLIAAVLVAPWLAGCGEPSQQAAPPRPPLTKEEMEKGPPSPANAAPPVMLK